MTDRQSATNHDAAGTASESPSDRHTPTVSNASVHPNPSEPNASTLETLLEDLESLRDRVEALEDTVERNDRRIERLEDELERALETNARLEERVRTLDRTRAATDARLDAHEKKLEANKERVGELQSRELEKGAHLLEANVDEGEIDVVDDRLERIRKDDGNAYFRLPESDDPLDRGGGVTVAHGDLLPIQQLSKMDDDMLRSTTSSLPARLAAKLWRARTDPTVGDDPWKRGSAGLREYVTAGDMKHWIRRQESGVSETYAKKLVSRTIDALIDLSKHRLAVERRRQRKNGLSYVERRVVLMEDADIPGEPTGRESSG